MSEEIVFIVPASKRPLRVRIKFNITLEDGSRPVEPLPPDMLIPPNLLRWGTDDYELEPSQYRILDAVLKHPKKRIEILDVELREMSEQSVRRKVRAINRILNKAKMGIDLRYEKGYVYIDDYGGSEGNVAIEDGFIDDEGVKLAQKVEAIKPDKRKAKASKPKK